MNQQCDFWLYFNPRSPHGERLQCALNRIQTSLFQPTLPARGATAGRGHIAEPLPISTHAPRTGSDLSFPGAWPFLIYFNPRSPHGERHQIRRELHHPHNFNPRSPHGERPSRRLPPPLPCHNFNPRSPHGERLYLRAFLLLEQDFNPRSPHGERLRNLVNIVNSKEFQPTLPARGATPPSHGTPASP